MKREASAAHTVPDGTYAVIIKEPNAARHALGRYDWPLCSDIQDPRLGLTYDQLTQTLEPLGLPDDWSVETAARLANDVWATLSELLGHVSGRRAPLGELQRSLLAVVITELPGRPIAFESFARVYWAMPRDERQLFASGVATSWWRRLATSSGFDPFKHVDGTLGTPTWTVKDPVDFAALDVAWDQATALADPTLGLVPRMDLRVLTHFFPTRRALAAGPDSPLIACPSLFELVAVMLVRGPRDWQRRGQVRLSVFASTELPKSKSLPARSTVHGVVTSINQIASGCARIAKRSVPSFAAWVPAPRVDITRTQLKAAPRKVVDTTAPPLALYRRATVTERRRIPSVASRAETFSKSRHCSAIRRCLLHEILAQTTVRIGMLVVIRLRDYEPNHRFLSGGIGPAIRMTQNKDVDLRIGALWRAIHPKTAELLDTWITGWGFSSEDDFLFPASRERRTEPLAPIGAAGTYTQFQSKVRPPVLPRPGGGAYSLHSLRHLGEQLARAVGRDWLDAHPEEGAKYTAQVFADAITGHSFREEVHAYKDLEANRQLWIERAGLGDPEAGVPGLIDRMFDDAGARRAWPDEDVRQVLTVIAATDLEIGKAEAREQEAQARGKLLLAELAKLPAPAAKSASKRDLDVPSLHRKIDEMARRDHLRDQQLIASNQETEAIRAVVEARRLGTVAKSKLELIEQAGRTRLLPDTHPLPHELAEGDLELESETFMQVVARVGAHIESMDNIMLSREDPGVMLRVRRHLNLDEFAFLYASTAHMVSRWARSNDGRTPPPGLTREGLNAALVVVGERRRVVDVSALSVTWRDSLTLDQAQALDALLMIPMGASQIGGRALSDDQVEALR